MRAELVDTGRTLLFDRPIKKRTSPLSPDRSDHTISIPQVNSRIGRVEPGGIKAETGGYQYTAENIDETGRMTRTETKLAEEAFNHGTGESDDMAPDLPDRASTLMKYRRRH